MKHFVLFARLNFLVLKISHVTYQSQIWVEFFFLSIRCAYARRISGTFECYGKTLFSPINASLSGECISSRITVYPSTKKVTYCPTHSVTLFVLHKGVRISEDSLYWLLLVRLH